MKRISLALIACCFGASASAYEAYEQAEVVESVPVYRRVEVASPRQECWREEVVRQRRDHHSRRDSRTPELFGALIGGALGNAVGHNKSNKRVGAVVGALLGGSIASDLRRDRSGYHKVYDTVENCRTVHDYHSEEKLVGYDVLYRYNDREYSVRLPQDPGAYLRVRVQVEPIL